MRGEREAQVKALLKRGKRFLLDTSVIIGYLHREPDAKLLELVIKASAAPFIALTELYYITWQKAGKAKADTMYGLVKAWHLPVLMPDERVVLTAGRLKALYSLGIADSYIAAFARVRNLVLLTRDPDYGILKEEVDLFRF